MSTASEGLTLARACELLHAEVLSADGDFSARIERVGAADLMSDVLALSQPGMLLLTGLVNPLVVRTAIIADLCGIVFVRGKKPGNDILDLAREARVPVLRTALTMFEAAGLLYVALTGG